MRAPEVLLLDDGELDDVASLLSDLQTRFERLRGGELRRDIPIPGRLLVATPRRVGALAEHTALRGTPNRVVVSEADSEGLRAQLREFGFDYLVRRPVHPEALRLLLLRCLYAGEEHREDARVVVGSPVSIRSGLLPREATLIDLSVGGCRLLSETPVPLGRRLRVRLPEPTPGKAGSCLIGRVVRVDPDGGANSDSNWRIGVAFELRDQAERTELERCVAQYTLGPASVQSPPNPAEIPGTQVGARRAPPARVGLSLEPEPAPQLETGGYEEEPDTAEQRESTRVEFARRVPAYGKSALRVLMGRDLSTRGMRVEPHAGLELGDRIHLAIYGDAEASPALVWATIRRDDGDAGLVALFDSVPAEVAEALECWVARLPAIESLQAGESQSLGSVLSEILTR